MRRSPRSVSPVAPRRAPFWWGAPLLVLLVSLGLPVGVVAPARTAEAADGKPTKGLRFPALTPDGKTVVFAWRGDIWRAPVGGGTAARLTIHEAQDTKPKVSPDGKLIAFSSRRSGSYDVYVMPIDGGEPRQVTFHSGAEIATDWSPDGKRLLISASRDPSEYGLDVYEVELAGGTPRRLTRDGGRDACYGPDGKTIVYVRGFNTLFQDDYVGAANYDVYVTDVDGALPRRLTDTPGNEMNPCVSADGQTVYCLAEVKGYYNIVAVPLGGGAVKPFTSWSDDNARRASLSLDRRTLAFEKDGRLCTVDLTAAEPKVVALPVAVESDVRNSGFDVRTVSDGAEHVSVSPDGSRIAVAVRGDLWVLPAGGGEAQRLTSGPATDDWPRFSPDGKRILFHSNARGNEDIYVYDLATKETKPITSDRADEAFATWAPDGQRIAFASTKSGNKDLVLKDLETGEERFLTRHPKDDDDPCFSPDGQWIAFDSGRDGTQAIYVMPVNGNDAQARRVSPGAGFFQVPSFSPDGTMLVYEEVDQSTGESGGLFAVKSSGGPAVQVSRDGNAACWSPRGGWIYFNATRDGQAGIFRVRAPQSIEGGERVAFLGKVTVDRRREFGDLFDEAWLRLKEGFYDPALHGVNWEAMKQKYRPIAVDAEIKDEFYNVVSQMLGELNASHLGIYGGRDEEEEDGAPGGAVTGFLGLELEPKGTDGKGRTITVVQTRGPADEAGLRVGDVIVSVAGRRLDDKTDLDRVLAGAAGKEVSVLFAKGDGSGERTVRVKAVPMGAINQLRYGLWVERNRKAVEVAAQGALAYLHVPQMDPPSLARFSAQLSQISQDKKVKGLVLDVRNNGGGNIHQQLLAALSAKPYIAFQPRGQPRQKQPQLHWGKPIVLLINERSFSDAEVFPYAFRELGLGKIVGVPTAGGVIGTNDITLSDGSRFRVPRVGWYGLNGENLERHGVKPDVVVLETPQDRREGRDPQLEKAIEVLRTEVAPAPEAKPTEKPAEKPAATPPVVTPPATPPVTPTPEPTPPETPQPQPEAPRPEAVKPEALKPESPKPEGPKPESPKPELVPESVPEPDGPEQPAAPTEKPNAAPAGADGFINPIHDAKVGEWLKMRLPGPPGGPASGSSGAPSEDRVLTVTVSDVTDTEVELTTTADAAEGFRMRRRELRQKEIPVRGERDGPDRLERVRAASGAEVECLVVTTKTRRGAVEKRYFSAAVPVTGILRVERDGRVVSEAVDWGFEAAR